MATPGGGGGGFSPTPGQSRLFTRSPTGSSRSSTPSSESIDSDFFDDDNSEDLSYANLDAFPEFLLERADNLLSLQLDHNMITVLPRAIGDFTNLISLDISNNHMTYMSPEIAQLTRLRSLTARNNNFDNLSLPKELETMVSLKVLNLAGNRLTEFPPQIGSLVNLRCLYLGANRLRSLPDDIGNLTRLQILYLGGNHLQHLPEEMGECRDLQSLILCDNRLSVLPHSLSRLHKLQSLSLHSNRLSTLPPGIVNLQLVELSLRNNPLVMRFVQDLVYDPPSLLELSGRVIKVRNVPYNDEELPRNLVKYLDSAHRCVNPKCKGVYFSSRVENINFVDFCGKYRLPLMEYLCSPNCKTRPAICISSESESEDEVMPMAEKMKKVLLG